MTERDRLEKAIRDLESKRAILGDESVDTALRSLRLQLAALDSTQQDTPSLSSDPSLTGERRWVTILFVDISGFTSLAETMDPEAVRNLVNACFSHLVPIIEKYGGTVTKFIGDCIEAVFGAPAAHENDPERALRCALKVMDAMEDFNSERDTDLRLHIGVNTGLVVAGGIGAGERQAYAVTGDAINLAARLEEVSRGGEILVGPDTYRQTSTQFQFETLPPIRMQGKRDPVPIYRLLGVKLRPARGRWLESAGISSPLVGREAALRTARGCIARLLDGEGGFLSVVGEAGLGKSRLMAEVKKRILAEVSDRSHDSQGLRWLEGRALSFGETMSYWPFQQILWQWSGITEEDSEGAAWDKLHRSVWALFGEDTPEVLPYLASLISLEVRAPYAERVKYLDGEALGRQIYLTSRRFFERLAQEKPLVLVFEDLHWADRSSSELLEHLLPLVERVPLLIIGVSRPGGDTPTTHLQDVADAEFADCHTGVRLKPLSDAQSRQLIGNLLAIDDLPPNVRHMIVQRAEGNPFFVEEIIRSLIDSDAVVRDQATGRWQATEKVKRITIPDTIQGVIMSRVDRLDDDLKEILRTAAVIGRSFFYRVLRSIAEAGRDLDGHLSELQAVELIREKQHSPELEYIFKHALAQEATYESILLERRRDLHARVGRAIEVLFAERLEEFYGLLAYHYARAEDWEKAHQYLLRAADQAGRVAADAEALGHYQQAMAAYERAFGDRWDPLQRAILEHKMGEAFFRRGDHHRAFDHLERALTLVGRPLPRSRLGVRWAIVRETIVHALHVMLPNALVRSTVDTVSPSVDLEVNTLRHMRWKFLSVDWERLLLTSLRMTNRSERGGYLAGRVRGLVTIGYCCFQRSLPWLAEEYHHRALALAEPSQDPALLGSVNVSSRFCAWGRGDWQAAVDTCSVGAKECLTAGNLHCWGNGMWAVAFALAQQGKLAAALACCQELIGVAQEGGERHLLCWGLQEHGRADGLNGHCEEAISALKKSAELADAVPDHATGVEVRALLGQLYLKQGSLDAALEALYEGERIRNERHIYGPKFVAPLDSGLAGAYLQAAEHATGSERDTWMKKARQACRAARKTGHAFPGVLPEAMRRQGTYEWHREKAIAAQRWWQRSMDLAQDLQQPYDLGMVHLEIGRRLGDRTHLEKAESVFAEIGAEWDLAQARGALGKMD